MSLDPWLLERLVCPVTRTPLRYDEAAQELVSLGRVASDTTSMVRGLRVISTCSAMLGLWRDAAVISTEIIRMCGGTNAAVPSHVSMKPHACAPNEAPPIRNTVLATCDLRYRYR